MRLVAAARRHHYQGMARKVLLEMWTSINEIIHYLKNLQRLEKSCLKSLAWLEMWTSINEIIHYLKNLQRKRTERGKRDFVFQR